MSEQILFRMFVLDGAKSNFGMRKKNNESVNFFVLICLLVFNFEM